MSSKAKFAVAVVLLVAATWLTIAFMRQFSTVSDDSDFDAVAAAIGDGSGARAPSTADATSAALVVERVAAAPDEAAPGSRRARLGARRVASLTGRVVDSRGRIVVGAAIEAVRPNVVQSRTLLTGGVVTPTGMADLVTGESIRTRSGPDGTFRFDDLVRGATFDIFAMGRTGRRGVVRDVRVGFADDVVVELQDVTTIGGVVVDARDERPVAGATVKIRNGTTVGSHPLVTTADGEGRFMFSGFLGTEVLAFAAAPDGRMSGPCTPPNFSPGDDVELKIRVGLAGAGAGRVVDAESQAPIPGATILEGEWSDLVATHSDEAGRFEIRPAYSSSSGVIQIIILASGYSRTVGNLRVANDADDPPPLTEFTMHRPGVALGRVVWRDGSPLVGATLVAAAKAKGGTLIADGLATTQADGSFRIEGIRTGKQHVLQLQHYECERLAMPFPDDEATRTEIDFGTIRVGRGAIVAGIVADDRGSPMAHAYISLATGYGDLLDVDCDAKGHFEFEGVPAGRALLRASPDGFKEPAELELDVDDEAIVESVALTIPTGLSISGRVSDVTGAPSVGAVVVLHRPNEAVDANHDIVATARADADGRFRFAGLAVGTYRLDVRAEKSDEMRSAAKQVERVDAGTTDLQVVLPDATFATGRVVDGTGQPVPGAALRLLGPDGTPVAVGNSDRDGNFRIAAPPDLELRIEARVFDPRHPTSVLDNPVAGALDHVRADGTPVTLVVETR